MSVSIRLSPQASKVLASESRSTASDATLIRMRVKKPHHPQNRKPSFYASSTSKVMPIHHLHGGDNEFVIINIIHDAGGAKAPSLTFEGMTCSP